MAVIDILHSYFDYITTQMASIDPTQVMGEISDANSWPQLPVNFGQLSLVTLGTLPSRISTQAQNHFVLSTQWIWILSGDDLSSSQRGENRGNRLLANYKVMNNLRQASYPGHCVKSSYSVDLTTGNVTSMGVQSVYPYSSVEMINWTIPHFMPRSDVKSGLIYGAAMVTISGFDDVLAAVA